MRHGRATSRQTSVKPPFTSALHGPWHNDGVRVLVVEDEQSLRDGIVDLLTGDGHDVTAVGDGVAGVEAGLRIRSTSCCSI